MAESKAVVERAMVCALAEVRGVAADTINWVDKQSGDKKSAKILKVAVELQPLSAAPCQCLISCDPEKTSAEQVALLVKGSKLVFSMTGLSRNAGVWQGRADRWEKYTS